ncbi:hypothetical protein SAMN05216548_101298 [Faunimonas pinastri]|uniref:DUF6314 domain-containing protein n=1 Tax=Faunimonas pinastri TaxID=1855383 RepID=A0A1H9A1M0_9HYPH|nr:DUF6314 family protein [Faunimonas pinastri]SEP70377.1 hypothetical protein SAMN05216548_101298 [Faunimonas pinastri]
MKRDPEPGGTRSVFDMLEGRWAIARTVEGQARFDGEAVFTPRADGRLDYLEEGELALEGGGRFHSARSYVYARRENGLAVFFEDGVSLFHEVNLSGPGEIASGTAEHLCRADTYRTRYDFEPGGARFTVTHRVTGPRKDYVMRSTYTRLG